MALDHVIIEVSLQTTVNELQCKGNLAKPKGRPCSAEHDIRPYFHHLDVLKLGMPERLSDLYHAPVVSNRVGQSRCSERSLQVCGTRLSALVQSSTITR